MRRANFRAVRISCIFSFLIGCSLSVAASAAEPDSRLADAAMNDQIGAARTLINAHVNVKVAQADGTTALIWAARSGDQELAELLISNGADVNTANNYGITALSIAATNGDKEMVAALLKAGADVNVATPEGQTVLMTASRAGNADVVKLLLDRDVNVNLRESWQQETALMWAAAENHPDVVRLLAWHGAEVNAKSKELAALKRTTKGVALQATHTTFPRGGLTPLLFAARQGSLESAQALVDAKANLNLTDPEGIGPLEMAIINANYDVAALLINAGADVNLPDRTGRTPLYAAVDIHKFEWIFSRPTPKASGKLESQDIVNLLLDKGANPNARLKGRILAFQHDSGGNANLTAGSTAFLKAASVSDVEMMKVLLAHGADPNLTNDAKVTPLMLAAGLNWQDIYNRGTEPESIEAIQLCLDHGVDIDAADSKGETALHGAAGRGADSVVRFLLSKGANLGAKTKSGRSALDEALGQDVVLDDSDVRRPVRESTVILLRQLMNERAAK